jgi:hypothetical protein
MAHQHPHPHPAMPPSGPGVGVPDELINLHAVCRAGNSQREMRQIPRHFPRILTEGLTVYRCVCVAARPRRGQHGLGS